MKWWQSKWFKIPAFVLGGILVLAVAVWLAGNWWLDKNKKRLIAELSATVEEKYFTQIQVEDLHLSWTADFPNLSLVVENIDAKGPMYKQHGHKLFSASEIYLGLKAFKLLLGKVEFSKTSLSNGNVFIYTDSSGLSNLSYFKSKQAKAKAKKKTMVLPDQLALKNFEVTIDDRKQEKLFSFLIKDLKAKTKIVGDSTILELEKNILVKNFSFNTPRGSFLKNHTLAAQFTLRMNNQNNSLVWDHAPFSISGNPFDISGKFVFTDSPWFSLRIKANAVPYAFAQSLLLPHISKAMGMVKLSAPVANQTSIDGSLKGKGDPRIKAEWVVKNSMMQTPVLDVAGASFTGYYLNEVVPGLPRKDSNSQIAIFNLRGKWEGVPINAPKVMVSNLTTPHLEGGFSSDFELKDFNGFLNGRVLEFLSGKGKLRVNYNGPLKGANKENAQLSALFSISNGGLKLVSQPVELNQCKALIRIDNSTVKIEDLEAKSKNGSAVKLTGQATNAFGVLDQVPGKANIVLNLYSPFMNLNGLVDFMGHPRTKRTSTKKGNLHRSLNNLDDVMKNELVTLNLKADRIQQGRLVATNMKALVKVRATQYQVDQLSFDLAGGHLDLSTSITDAAQGSNKVLNSKIKIDQIGAKELFYAFEDFGMKGLTHENLKGQLSAKGEFSIQINKTGTFDKSSLVGKLWFDLRNGELNNYAPLTKIQEKIFKNRNFSQVKLANLNNELRFNKGQVEIPRMQIQTSIMHLFVEGIYGMSGPTDLRIQVPLKNLRKTEGMEMPKSSDNTAKGGASIYLRAKSDGNGPVGISLDALGAVRKTKVEAKIK